MSLRCNLAHQFGSADGSRAVACELGCQQGRSYAPNAKTECNVGAEACHASGAEASGPANDHARVFDGRSAEADGRGVSENRGDE